MIQKAIHIALFVLSFAQVFGASAVAQPPADERAPVLLWELSRERQREYVEYLKKRSDADPGNRRLLLDLARGYYSLAMEQDVAAIAEAEKLFDRLLADEPQNAMALVYRGALLGFRLGFGLTPQDQMFALMQESTANLDRAVALAPDDMEIRGIRGYVSFFTPSYLSRDQFAVEDFAHIIRLLERQPDTERRRAELHLTLGDAYRKAGDDENARRSWLRAIELSPGASAAIAAESRLRYLADPTTGSNPDFKEIVSFFGFTIGAAIFAILSFLLLRDLKRARRRRAGIRAALFVSLAAFAWNGMNLLSVIFNALGEPSLGGLRAWRQSELALFATLSPIPFGLIAAYRFYKATFMDIALKRGAALIVLFTLSAIYGKLIALPASLALVRVSNDTLRWIFYTAVWLWLYALYPPLRDRIYKLVDRHLFKRRDHSGCSTLSTSDCIRRTMSRDWSWRLARR